MSAHAIVWGVGRCRDFTLRKSRFENALLFKFIVLNYKLFISVFQIVLRFLVCAKTGPTFKNFVVSNLGTV